MNQHPITNKDSVICNGVDAHCVATVSDDSFSIKKAMNFSSHEKTAEILQGKLASSNELKTVLITTLDEFKKLKTSWNELYNQCNRSTVFSSWEWMFTWWEVFKEQNQRQLYILCFYQGNKLVGIAPFQIEIFYPQSLVQGKTLCFIGFGDSKNDRILTQYVDFIVLPGFESKMIESVEAYLVQHKRDWQFADFEYLLKDSLILQCFLSNKNNIARQKVDYGVRFSVSGLEDFESYMQTMGRRWKKMFAKKERLLLRDGELTIDSTESLESIDPAFHLLSEMHCSRWKDRVDHCIFESELFCDFHKKVLKRLLPLNKAFIKTLKLNDESLASYYIFTDKGQVHYYQSGFYSKYANKYSPLFILVCKEIGLTIENKQVFDFMYTDTENSYKKNQYAANYEKMYRLRWASQPLRLFVFICAKTIYVKVLDLYCCTKLVRVKMQDLYYRAIKIVKNFTNS